MSRCGLLILEARLAGKARLLVVVLIACTLLFGGCNPPSDGGKTSGTRVDRIAKTSAEQQKAKLLKQIDRKFEDPEAHFQLGQLYRAQRRWDEAEYHYNNALTFDPVFWPAQAAKVNVLLESGRKRKGELTAEVYINEVAGSPERSLQLALAFQEQQLDDYALACYRQALRLAPDSAKIHRQIGYYYLSRGDKVRAKEHLVRSFNIDPLQADVAYDLGRMGVEIDMLPRKKNIATQLDRMVEKSGRSATP